MANRGEKVLFNNNPGKVEVFQSLQKIVLMNLNQFLILVLSVETRHIGGAIILWGKKYLRYSAPIPRFQYFSIEFVTHLLPGESLQLEQRTSNPILAKTITPLKCVNYIYFQKHCIVSVLILLYLFHSIWICYGHRVDTRNNKFFCFKPFDTSFSNKYPCID